MKSEVGSVVDIHRRTASNSMPLRPLRPLCEINKVGSMKSEVGSVVDIHRRTASNSMPLRPLRPLCETSHPHTLNDLC